ncbi:indole-3-glycerol phosphate synthase TrpC [Brachybacterium alimentarium]|uniref:indole-3-glycerol phosphate synthase TrpC n=1 Tax=Brachybacterium alimentarium TaxID=47845 RepID=UPI000DF1CF4C|nr:indole-3-glycerol phosphate synthase TrpC [Brachybacterium alimentarium]RCS75600.1 indole-3-glycerol phosphate synthase TrpC [Brachybacterium alimentarium]
MTTTGTVLDEIIAGVREDLEVRRAQISVTEIERLARAASPARDARAALVGDGSTMGLIAEVKRASPSKGSLADIPVPADLAEIYATHGASAISVLTEQRRFRGTLADLDAVRERVQVPVLRKDFVVDPYQVFEARAHGADLVLLIVAALDDDLLRELYDLIAELGMQALVETHTEEELDRALALGADLIGVNARNLKTLDVDLSRAAALLQRIPRGPLAIGESAVLSVDDVEAYAAAGADAVLVGEALVTAGAPAASVTAFRQVARRGRPAPEGAQA